MQDSQLLVPDRIVKLLDILPDSLRKYVSFAHLDIIDKFYREQIIDARKEATEQVHANYQREGQSLTA